MDERIESFLADGEIVVHCFERDGVDHAYFSRTGDAFALSPESSVGLREIENGGSASDAVDRVREMLGLESAARFESDLSVMEELGLLDQESVPSDRASREIVESYLEHRPRNLMFFLTEKCNLKCLYCYESLSGVHDRGSVLREVDGREILKEYFDRSRGRRVVKITFFGGEPLSNWSVFEKMVLFAEEEADRRSQCVRFTTTSNLTLLDEAKADFLVEHGFTVMVSIDGDRETHDSNRRDKGGRGTYDKVAQNLRMLIRKCEAAGIRLPRLRATWVPGVSNRRAIEDHLLSFGTGKQLVNVGMASYDEDHSELYAPEEDGAGSGELDAIRDIEVAIDGGEIPSWLREALEKVDREVSRESPHDSAAQQLCGVCRNMLAVTPTGDYYPCHRYVGMDGFKLGNVKDGGPDRSKVENFYEKVQASFKAACSQCWARHLCGGTCSWLLSDNEGNVDTPSFRTCSKIRASYELILATYTSIASDDRLKARFFD